MDNSNFFAETLDTIILWLEQHISHVITALFILLGAVILSNILSRVLGHLLTRTVRVDMFPSKVDRDRRLQTLNSISVAIATFIVWAVAIIMVLNTLGINTGPLLASAGILSVALGFGAQSLVRDFVTGVFIIAENQYRVGDYIEIQNVKGTVVRITMRTTVIKDDSGSIFHVPNGSIIITGNHTMGNKRISILLSVAGDTNIQKLITIIDKTGKEQNIDAQHKEQIEIPLHFERIKDITGNVIFVSITGKVRAGKRVAVRSDYLLRLQAKLSKNKIELK